MDEIILQILEELRAADSVDERSVERMLNRANSRLARESRTANAADVRILSKRRLLHYYLKLHETRPDLLRSWNVDAALDARMLAALQMKPRRTASGVATITVITKPHACTSNCLYCPVDLRMPKSYLADEPACQRAERNWFDPYLQVTSRLRALTQMGHLTDKVELIVLGGTWSDYPQDYQVWFVKELFRALNEFDTHDDEGPSVDAGSTATGVVERRGFYRELQISNEPEVLACETARLQSQVDAHELTYNEAMHALYDNGAWAQVSQLQKTDPGELEHQQKENETAAHRAVGLVIETRPDRIDARNLTLYRHLGCTKIQIGVQSLDQRVLDKNDRGIRVEQIARAFELLRIFGFKIHAHFMANLYGSDARSDRRDFQRFVTDPAFLPDEIKLYPCALIDGTGLIDRFEDGSWRPYDEDELVDLLVDDTLAARPFMRISRMIRDFSAGDIVAGNRKVNLRQLVEERAQKNGDIVEIRHREIATDETDIGELHLEVLPYETTMSREFFLQWVTDTGRIAGFLRLSLPDASYIEAHRAEVPVDTGEAMIREVHVYGKVAALHHTGSGAQHLGLGRQLVRTACRIARENGYPTINVISSVGTREYYRSLGFKNGDLYQQMSTATPATEA